MIVESLLHNAKGHIYHLYNLLALEYMAAIFIM